MKNLTLVVLFFAAVITGCSNNEPTSVTPPTGKVTALVLTNDSVYCGEQFGLIARGLPKDTTGLRVLIRDRNATILRISGDTIFLRIERASSSGDLLVMKGSTSISGVIPLHVFPYHVDDFFESKILILPGSARRGEVVRIYADHLPKADRISLSFNGKPAIYAMLDTNVVAFYVPGNAVTGLLRLNVFGNALYSNSFTIDQEAPPALLSEGTLSYLRLEAKDIDAVRQVRQVLDGEETYAERDTGYSVDKPSRTFDRVAGSLSNDSIIFKVSVKPFDVKTNVSVELKYNKDSTRVSGRISFGYDVGDLDAEHELYVLELNEVTWVRTADTYLLTARGPEIKYRFPHFDFNHTVAGSNYKIIQELVDYRGGITNDSYIRIYLRP